MCSATSTGIKLVATLSVMCIEPIPAACRSPRAQGMYMCLMEYSTS